MKAAKISWNPIKKPGDGGDQGRQRIPFWFFPCQMKDVLTLPIEIWNYYFFFFLVVCLKLLPVAVGKLHV